MYCVEPLNKRQKTDSEFHENDAHKHTFNNDVTGNNTGKDKSPVLENKERSFKKSLRNNGIIKRLSKFPKTVMDNNVVESKFFSTSTEGSKCSIQVEDSPEKSSKNPFKVSKSPEENCEIGSSKLNRSFSEDRKGCNNIIDLCTDQESSQKENSPCNSPVKIIRPSSPILEPSPRTRNPFRRLDSKFEQSLSEDSVIENTYPMETLITPVDSQVWGSLFLTESKKYKVLNSTVF